MGLGLTESVFQTGFGDWSAVADDSNARGGMAQGAVARRAAAPLAGGLGPRQSLLVGVTLFSMFFGAGNLILPPLLGLQAGADAVPAMAGFLVAGIGLPVLGIIAVALSGTIRQLADRVHPLFSTIFVAAVYLAIGPCLAIPRTSSTSFEMLVPLLPQGADVATIQVAFSVVFFVAAYLLAFHPGQLTRLLGKLTGPALVALIVVVTVSSIVAPTGGATAAQAPYNDVPLAEGFLTGYQTMDLLASLTFGIVIAQNIRGLGVTDDAGLTREISKAGVFMAVLMGLIYCGFAYVGVTMGSVMPDATNGAEILTASATAHFGLAGTVVVALIFLLACLNVCIGLISCCGTYFAEQLHAPYRWVALAFAVFSGVVSNFGLDAILAFSVPLLSALYPMAIVLVAMGLTHRALEGRGAVWPCVVALTGIVSVCEAVRSAVAPDAWLPTDVLPLAGFGLAWVIPAVVGLVLGLVVSRVRAGRE